MTPTTIKGPDSGGILLHSNLAVIIPSFLALYIIYYLILRLQSTFNGPLSKFPGPKTSAFSILPLVSSIRHGDDGQDVSALHKRFGRVVRVGPNRLSFVGSADTWRDIYGFRKSGQLENIKDPFFYGENINRTPGIINADHETHSRQRKVVSHAFSDRALKEQEPMLKMWAGKLRERLAECAGRDEKVDMLKMWNCTTFDIMGDLTFAEPLGMLDNSEYTPWVKTIFGGIKSATGVRAFRMLGSLSDWVFKELVFRSPAMRLKQTEHWKYTTDRVDRRLARTPDRPDLWSRILEKSDNFTNLNKQEHYSIASLFMIAGTETTATLLSGLVYHLLSQDTNPIYLEKLRTEIRSTFTDMDSLHLDPLAQLPYLEAVIKEAFRMYPPVPIGLPRIAPPGGLQVGEHFVPEGTVVAVHQLSTYQYPGNFKDAEHFRPERWLGDAEFKDDRLDALEPFSVGPRNCLGKNLAWHEMRLLISTVLLHFDLELCEESARWADQKVYTLWEKPPLMVKLKEVR